MNRHAYSRSRVASETADDRQARLQQLRSCVRGLKSYGASSGHRYIYVYLCSGSPHNALHSLVYNIIYNIIQGTVYRVKRGKTERGVKRNTCIQRAITKQGINRTTLYCRTLRYNHQRIHACKTFGLTAYHHRNTAH